MIMIMKMKVVSEYLDTLHLVVVVEDDVLQLEGVVDHSAGDVQA